jgi:hypothetical protein
MDGQSGRAAISSLAGWRPRAIGLVMASPASPPTLTKSTASATVETTAESQLSMAVNKGISEQVGIGAATDRCQWSRRSLGREARPPGSRCSSVNSTHLQTAPPRGELCRPRHQMTMGIGSMIITNATRSPPAMPAKLTSRNCLPRHAIRSRTSRNPRRSHDPGGIGRPSDVGAGAQEYAQHILDTVQCAGNVEPAPTERAN